MIRIRTGTAWRHDPGLPGALRRADRASVSRAIEDAIAIEVDGIDLAAGRAEGALLPTLEALLRGIARVVAGAPHATVTFGDGAIELLVRRRGASALLTVVSLSPRPSRVLAGEVEVELETLAAAALEAAAELCRELAEVAPDAARDAHRLQAAARDLRRTEAGPPPRLRPAVRARRTSPRPASSVACDVELGDDEGILLAYEGGRPDLGSLLVPGRVTVRAGATELLALPGYPFLALRDLTAAAQGVLDAAARGDATVSIPVARPGRGAGLTLEVDLARGRVSAGSAEAACPPLDLVRAVAEAALELGRIARARNPRQSENGYLVELETTAAERLALAEELGAGDLAQEGAGAAEARTPERRPVSQEPLGPGRLRHLSFRRQLQVEVGRPAGDGLFLRPGAVIAAGADAVVAASRASGAILWRAAGAASAFPLPGALLVVRGERLAALSLRGGATRWERPIPGAAPASAIALARGPWLVGEPGALTAVDPDTGRTLWRFAPPGAHALGIAPFRGIAAVAADTGFVYGVDASGRTAWRVRAPGPLSGAPVGVAGACLVRAEAGPGSVLLAVDPASGVRLWEAPLDLGDVGPPIAWGGRIVVGGTVGGDAAVTVLHRTGVPAWTAAPALRAAPALAVAGPLLVACDGDGALVALGRDGAVRWSRPAAPVRTAGPPPPLAVGRGAVLVGGEAITCLDARTGSILGAVPAVAPIRLAVDRDLGLAALDADGIATGFRLARRLSVL